MDMKNTVEYGLNLGLSLSELQNIQKVIEGIKEKDSEIVSIKVFDDKGASVFDTEGVSEGEMIPEEWRKIHEESGKDLWNMAFKESFVIGVPLYNNFDVMVGGLAISYSKAHIEGTVKKMGFFMGKSVIITLLVFALITVIGMGFFLRKITGVFNKMDSSLQFLLAGDSVAPAATSTSTDLERRFNEFHARSREVLDTLEQAEKDLGGNPPSKGIADIRENLKE